MNKVLAFYLLVFMTIASCSEDDSVMESEDSLEPLVELQFTNSPIELQGIKAMFASDISYNEYDKTKFDVFLPSSTTPTGLVIFIHGGGFRGGDKTFIYNDNYKNEVIELLSNDIAVATINYRLISTNDNEGVLKSLSDSKRALQYIRYIHNELNIDKEKIALFGSSAGASTALWLATNDDLKDINSSEAVLQESTRVKGIALNGTQSSLDIETRWLGDVFIEFGITIDDIIQEFGTETLYSFYGVSNQAEYETSEIETYRQEVDMLSLLSADDPEIWVKNTGGHNNEPMTTSSFNHHAFHAREIKEFADAAGVPNIAIYGNPILYDNSNNESFIQFLTRKINE
jgi:pimeloyl-ACP methyl ester carboxylesterase